MSFEKYSKTRTMPEQRATATINKSGRIFLNDKCISLYLPKFENVQLFYDAKEQLVGLKPGSKTDRDSYSLTRIKKGKTRIVHSVGFFKHYGVYLEKTRRYDPRWDEKFGLLVLDLKTPRT